jgi:hypothetical protein
MNDIQKDKSASGLSIAALVTGILSIFPVFGIGTGIAAIVCGALDLKKQKGLKEMNISKGFDIAGIVLGSLALIAGLVILIAAISAAIFFSSQNWEFWGIPLQSFM